MKTTIKLLLAIAILFSSTNVLFAKKSEKQLIKSAQKEAKKYQKGGYYVAPGAPMLGNQLQRL